MFCIQSIKTERVHKNININNLYLEIKSLGRGMSIVIKNNIFWTTEIYVKFLVNIEDATLF